MRYKKLNILLIVSLIFLVSVPNNIVAEESNNFEFIALYSTIFEKNRIETALSDLNTSRVNISIQSIYDFNFSTLINYNFLFLTNSKAIPKNYDRVRFIEEFVEKENTSSIFFTPYLNNFSRNLQNTIGIAEISNRTILQGTTNYWTGRFDQQLGQFKINDPFYYFGRLGPFRKQQNVTVIASITGSNSSLQQIQDLPYPLEAIINATRGSNQIITSGMSLNYRSNLLKQSKFSLNQVPPVNDILEQIFEYTLSYHSYHFNPISKLDGQNISEDAFFPSFAGFQLDEVQIIVILIIILLSLLAYKIVDIIRWFSDKLVFGAFFVIGAFYNVQDRNLTDSEVMTNEARIKIIHFLEYIGEFGAHLREIKGNIKMGMGILLWHLQVLEDYGWIEQYKIDRHTVFVASEYAHKFDIELKSLELRLKSKHCLTFLNFMLEHDEVSIPEIARETGIDKKTIRRFSKVYEEFEIFEAITKKRSSYIKVLKPKILTTLGESIQLREEYDLDNNGINISFE